MNKPFTTAGDDLAWTSAGAAFVGASANMGGGVGASVNGAISTVGKEALGIVGLGIIAFHSIVNTGLAVWKGCSE